jgi:hypothetical protein
LDRIVRDATPKQYLNRIPSYFCDKPNTIQMLCDIASELVTGSRAGNWRDGRNVWWADSFARNRLGEAGTGCHKQPSWREPRFCQGCVTARAPELTDKYLICIAKRNANSNGLFFGKNVGKSPVALLLHNAVQYRASSHRSFFMKKKLPGTGFLRLSQILGKNGDAPIIPVSARGGRG